MPGRGTRALWPAVKWACRLDIYGSQLRAALTVISHKYVSVKFCSCVPRLSDRTAYDPADQGSAVRIHPVKEHHEAGLGVEGECDAPQVSDQTHQSPLQETPVREESHYFHACLWG